MSDSDHMFGGPWTEVKLDAVEYYLECYTKALSRLFELWYIDGFAGTGERTQARVNGGLLGQPLEVRIEVFAGSAKRALAVEPTFNHLVFIEQDPERCEALEALRRQHPDREIQILPGDTNDVLRTLIGRPPWTLKDKSAARGIVFLDPYAMQVEWKTLLALAETRVVDVWYLFPLQAVIRQLAHSFDGIGVKEPKLDRVLGPEWRALYDTPEEKPGLPLFDLIDREAPEKRRAATKRQVETWFHWRLASIFAYASEPLPILTTHGRQDFSLFLAVANRSEAAVKLAKQFAKHVNKHYGPMGAGRFPGKGKGARSRGTAAP
jgi:three-Cys-motif partner protein